MNEKCDHSESEALLYATALDRLVLVREKRAPSRRAVVDIEDKHMKNRAEYVMGVVLKFADSTAQPLLARWPLFA